MSSFEIFLDFIIDSVPEEYLNRRIDRYTHQFLKNYKETDETLRTIREQLIFQRSLNQFISEVENLDVDADVSTSFNDYLQKIRTTVQSLVQALEETNTEFTDAMDQEIPSFFENPEESTEFARFATQVYYLYYRSSIKPEEVPKLLPIMYATLLRRYHPLQNVEIYIQEGNDPTQVPLLILKWKDQQTKEEKTRVLSTTF